MKIQIVSTMYNNINNHPLAPYIPSKKVCSYNLRKKQCARPKIDTCTERAFHACLCKQVNIQTQPE